VALPAIAIRADRPTSYRNESAGCEPIDISDLPNLPREYCQSWIKCFFGNLQKVTA
jgi:hypothetical protein